MLFLLVFIPECFRSVYLIKSNINYTSDNHESNNLKTANFGSNLLDSNFVVSVEHINLMISSSETYASVLLSKNQIVSNCVPFVSMKSDYIPKYDWNVILGDVYFDPSLGEITIERSIGDQNSLDFSVYIVEFDPTKIKIQQGSFNLTGETSTIPIEPVNLSKAFPLSYWYAAHGDDGWDHAMVATNISSDNAITFERGQSTGNNFGHYYIIESLGNEFTIQSTELTFSGISANNDISKDVDMSKSIVISSIILPI